MTAGRFWRSITLGWLAAASLWAADPEPRFFSNYRDVHISDNSRTNYVAIDNEIWLHARPDLADLRLYDNSHVVPYALRMQGLAEAIEQHPVRILNKGVVPGYTQFVLDMTGFDVYDEIALELSQHDFDRLTNVEGSDALRGGKWTQLTTTPIFDFTKQKLGSNLSIKLPPSSFRYLRVSISRRGIDHGNLVLPQHIHGATALNSFRSTAVWDDAGGKMRRKEQGHDTILFLDMIKAAPVDRLHFVVPADRVNFRRLVTIETRGDDTPGSDDEGWQTLADGDISRLRSNEGNTADDLDINTHDTRASHWRITIRNGDDPPIPIKLVAQSLERRLYFDPKNAAAVKLYYGDQKVGAPVYDYDKFFREADVTNAAVATLGPEMVNVPAPRPDERPWSERHQWVLWVAMGVAVLGIGLVALRGLRKA